MKNKLLLGAMLIGATGLFTACSDDNDSNPTLIQPTEFALNTPAYVNETVDLSTTEALHLTWSQPRFTADNAPINATYEIQVSLTGNYNVSTDEADAAEEDENNTEEVVADYTVINKTSTTCYADLASDDLAKALVKLAKWEDGDIPATLDTYIRINAFVAEGTSRLNAVASNAIKLNVNPYYIELSDAAPIMFYITGDNIGDGAWSANFGTSSFPMFLQAGYAYDKVTGGGEITYLNYFTTDGWKLNPADFNWDYGFMGAGENEKNVAIYRDGGADKGNILCDPAGYYLVTVNTAKNECTIKKQDITPAVYDQICITGSFCDWADVNMIPVNKSGENHVWAYTLTVDEGNVEEIKFKIPESWDINWGYGAAAGDINVCGKGTNGGNNIGVAAGTWIVMFNDITGEFSIIAQ